MRAISLCEPFENISKLDFFNILILITDHYFQKKVPSNNKRSAFQKSSFCINIFIILVIGEKEIFRPWICRILFFFSFFLFFKIYKILFLFL